MPERPRPAVATGRRPRGGSVGDRLSLLAGLIAERGPESPASALGPPLLREVLALEQVRGARLLQLPTPPGLPEQKCRGRRFQRPGAKCLPFIHLSTEQLPPALANLLLAGRRLETVQHPSDPFPNGATTSTSCSPVSFPEITDVWASTLTSKRNSL